MKYFIVADVHGFYNEMIKALEDAGFDKENPEHFFVSLGDLLDRGRQPIECLKFVNSLERKILIRGNHEDLLDNLISRKFYGINDLHNGTVQTVLDLEPSAVDYYDAIYKLPKNELLESYRNSLVDYAEAGKNIFVHGWVPCKNDKKEKCWRKGNWGGARWLNGMECWQNKLSIKGKTIYCGHWHTSWGHHFIENKCSEFGKDADFSPFVAKGIVALDACTAYSKKINCYVIEVN